MSQLPDYGDVSDQIRVIYEEYLNTENDDEEETVYVWWAWTIWKSQGQKIRVKVSLNLGRGEKEHGLSYVAMSSVTPFFVIGLYEGITYTRIFNMLLNHKIMTPRINDGQRFHYLFARTQVFIRNI